MHLVNMCDDGVVASRIGVLRGDVALWGRAVSVSAPGGDEGCEVAVRLRQGDGMVAVPGVKDGFLGVAWNGSRLVEGGLTVVCFPCCVLV